MQLTDLFFFDVLVIAAQSIDFVRNANTAGSHLPPLLVGHLSHDGSAHELGDFEPARQLGLALVVLHHLFVVLHGMQSVGLELTGLLAGLCLCQTVVFV